MSISLELTFPQIVGGDSAPLVGVNDWIEYTADGKRGKRLGTSYDILLVNSFCEKLRIHVPDDEPAVTADEVSTHNSSMLYIMAKFPGFSAKPYSRDGKMQISAKADKIVILNNNSGTGVAK